MHRLLALHLLLGLAYLGPACIDANRAEPTTTSGDTTTPDTSESTDTSEPDAATTSPPDTTSLPDTTSPPDTTVGDTITSDTLTCTRNADCTPPGGDRSPCKEYMCSETGTCIARALPDETPCDDGIGLPFDECIAGWYGFVDRCLAGVCKADVDGFQPDSYPLAGDWYAVVSRTPSASNAGYHTLRSVWSVADNGAISVDLAQSLDPAWAAAFGGADPSPASTGFACASPTGRINVGFAPLNYAGYRNPSDDVFIFGGLQGSELGVAVRPLSGPVDGTYILVATAVEIGPGGPRLVTRTGTVAFAGGCVSDITSYTTDGTTRAFIAKGESHCLVNEPGDDDAYRRLSMTILPTELSPAGQGRDELWRGVVARGGNLLLMTIDATDHAPAFGTVVLVRQGDESPFNESIAGRWAVVSQQGGWSSAADPNARPFVRWGMSDLTEEHTLSGTIIDHISETEQVVSNGWYLLSGKGRYQQRVQVDKDYFHAGIGALGSDLIVGFVAFPPVSGTGAPAELSTLAAEGSLVFMTPLQKWE